MHVLAGKKRTYVVEHGISAEMRRIYPQVRKKPCHTCDLRRFRIAKLRTMIPRMEADRQITSLKQLVQLKHARIENVHALNIGMYLNAAKAVRARDIYL